MKDVSRFVRQLSFPVFVYFYVINDTKMEKLCFIQFSTRMAGWLLLTFLICLRNLFYIVITYSGYKCLKNVIHPIDNKNEWLLPASFTAKFELVFVLTLENAFS